MDNREQGAIIESISRADAKGNCILTVKHLKANGDKLDFPTTYRDIPDASLREYNVGDTVTILTKKGRPKDKVEEKDKGNELKAFWWDYTGIRKGNTTSAPAPASAAPTPGAQPSATGAQAQGQASGGDSREASIQRQVALKAAVEMAVANAKAGEPVLSLNVVKVAALFNRFLVTGQVPTTRATDPQSQQREDVLDEMMGEQEAA